MYLLDTNHFSRLIQGNATVRQGIATIGESDVAISIITAGEIYYMAYIQNAATPTSSELKPI